MTASLAGRRVAIYARFSSLNQREASIDDQVRRCREHIQQQGGMVEDALIFTDSAVSGASLDRRGFEEMMRLVDARPRLVDAIVTEDLSRITRDFADAAALFKRLQYVDVPLLGVADGIDTSATHAKLSYGLKALVSDVYLSDLSDKTKRGLAGRALAGYSTGGLPYGYRSVPEHDGRGGVVGYRVLVEPAQAAVVCRIFTSYANGMSYAAIAGALNAEGVPPPRAHSSHRKRGWTDSTIRAILKNRAYIGETAFRAREWRRLPGTNKRRYRKRDEREVIRRQYADRRVVDQTLWDAVQARLASVRAKYVGDAKMPRAPGHRTSYPLSGLLHCAACGSTMVITGGSAARYYICGSAKSRRLCTNRLSVREDVARRCILGAIREQLTAAGAVDYLRRQIAERLGAASRDANREIDERRARLARTEARIRGVIDFIAAGDQSEYMRATLLDLESQAKTEKAEIQGIISRSKSPVRLPTPDQVLERVLDLERTLAADPVRAREALRRLLVDGRITLEPGADGVYVATFTFLPMVLVAAESVGTGGVGVPLSVALA